MMVEEILLQESRPRKQPVRIRTGEGIQEDHLKHWGAPDVCDRAEKRV